MSKNKKSKLWALILRYKIQLLIGLLLAIFFIGMSLCIIFYNPSEPGSGKDFWLKLADLLMVFGETIIVAGLIGGGIGASINFILEEIKEEEAAVKERLKGMQESKEKRKLFRQEMRKKLQHAHDEVELARILIKSHKSGKTYGEQVRYKIMPSLIALLELKRGLMDIEDALLSRNLAYLKVSLRYMIAYLSVLVEEFEGNYLHISNLQSYQDTMGSRIRSLFMDATENKLKENLPKKKKKKLLKETETFFGNSTIPSNIEIVWEAIKKLDYISDFIDELRSESGEKSLYNRNFLYHYYHCKKLLKPKENSVNEKLIAKKSFQANIEELIRIEAKEKSDRPLTKQDSLTRRIMEKELNFDFQTDQMKVKK